jgi:hypothetical protein
VLALEFPSAVAKAEGAVAAATRRLILGGDAQTVAWASVVGDFPELVANPSPVYAALRIARGGDMLAADVLKVSHHGAKHGIERAAEEGLRPRHPLHERGRRGGAGLGTIAVVVPPTGRPQVWRFGDVPSEAVDLTTARRFA